jgi:hypothetical protein
LYFCILLNIIGDIHMSDNMWSKSETQQHIYVKNKTLDYMLKHLAIILDFIVNIVVRT